jgi:hypothetical protein
MPVRIQNEPVTDDDGRFTNDTLRNSDIVFGLPVMRQLGTRFSHPMPSGRSGAMEPTLITQLRHVLATAHRQLVKGPQRVIDRMLLRLSRDV